MTDKLILPTAAIVLAVLRRVGELRDNRPALGLLLQGLSHTARDSGQNGTAARMILDLLDISPTAEFAAECLQREAGPQLPNLAEQTHQAYAEMLKHEGQARA